MEIGMTIEPVGEVQVQDGNTLVVDGKVPQGGPADWGALNASLGGSHQPAPTPAPVPAVPIVPQVQPAPVVPAAAVPAPVLPVAQPPAAEGQPPAPAVPAQVAPAPVEPPAKFVGADGKVQTDKLIKSYRELERELGRRGSAQPQVAPVPQGQVAQPPMAAPVQPPVQAAPGADPFIAQLDNDVKAFGVAPVMAKLFEAAAEVGYRRASVDFEGIRQERQNDRMREELGEIAKTDPAILSEGGYAKLTSVLRDNPHLMSSPTPWTDAYAKLAFLERVRPQGGPVPSPTPMLGAAPVAPASGARPAGMPVQTVQIETKEQLEAHLQTLNKQQQEEFWNRYAASIGWKIR